MIFFDSEIKVAEVNGEVAGFVAYKPHNLSYIYVDPQFQRCGVSDKLMATVLPNMKKTIRLEVLSKNVAAKALYAKHGFKTIKTQIKPWCDSQSELVSLDTMELV